MPSRLPRRAPSAHQEAVARRLAALSDQLAATRSQVTPPSAGQVGHAADTEQAVSLAPAAGAEWWSEHTHVSPSRPPLVLVPAPPQPTQSPELPELPVPPEPARAAGPVVATPGRHAARRRLSIADVLPDTVLGQVRLGAGQVAVVAVLVALGLAVTAWWVVRSHPGPPVVVAAPDQVVPPLAATAPVGGAATVSSAAAIPPGQAVSSSPAVPASSTPVTVDVAGRVRHPGIVVLPPGARVVDAVRRAGGARSGVDLTSLNLARPLVDGEQILVGVRAPVGTTGVSPPPTTSTLGAVPGVPPGAPVDLNTATEAELEALPDVGPVTAGAIVAWRDQHGGFSAVSELLEVDGIGEATLAKLTPLVTV